MARKSFVICLLALVTFLLRCALAFSAVPNNVVGPINMFNGARTDISFFKWVIFANNTRVNDPYYTVLPKSTSYQFQIMEDMMDIFSEYHMANSTGIYDQTILDWSTGSDSPHSCDPECFWFVDESGFSVAGSSHQQLRFITGWNGPHMPL